MLRYPWMTLLLLVVLLFSSIAFVGMPPGGVDKGSSGTSSYGEEIVPDEVLISVKPGYLPSMRLQDLRPTHTGLPALDRVNRTLQVQSLEPLIRPGIGALEGQAASGALARVFRVKLPPGTELEGVLRFYRQQEFIEYAEPNHVYRALDFIPNDPNWNNQWALQKVQMPKAWEISQGRSEVIIAVLDTGVDYTHPDLASKVIQDKDYDFINNDNDAMDDHGHGTHVAGTAAAATNNGIGIAGVCPQCRILPIKVLDSQGFGSDATVAQGINYAVNQGAKIINLSLGGASCSETLAQAINGAFEKGVLIVAASGNSGKKTTMMYPAASPRVIAVGATDQNDGETTYSQRGPGLDVLAPGEGIVSTVPLNGYGSLSGTSMAAPHVAGVAGLLWSRNPAWCNTEVWWALRYTADPAYLMSITSLQDANSTFSVDQPTGPWQLFLPFIAKNWWQPGRLNAYRALLVNSPGQVEAPLDVCSP